MAATMMTSIPPFTGLPSKVHQFRSEAWLLFGRSGAAARELWARGAITLDRPPICLMLFAGRFRLAPSAITKSTAGLKLEVRESGLQTGDPAGFTLADTLACGSVGHIIGAGVVLGLKIMGAL